MLQYILALLAILIFVILIIKKPQIETYVLYVLSILPIIDTKILPLAYGFVKTFDVITILALFILSKDFFNFNRPMQYKTYFVLTILLWFTTIVSGLNSEFGFGKFHTYYPILTIFIFTRFIFLFVSKNSKNFGRSITAFKKAYVAILIFMTLQIIFGLQVNYYGDIGLNVLDETTGMIRYPGIFSESQVNGQFLALGSFVVLIFIRDIEKRMRLLSYFVFVFSILFLFLAGSRSAIGGFIVGVVYLFLTSPIRIKIYGFLIGFVAIIFLITIGPKNGVLSRTQNISGDLDFRQSIWEETYKIIQDHPLLGVGMGNFQEYTEKYYQGLYLEISPGEYLYFTQPENGYLKILVEQGGIVFLIFLIFILLPFSMAVFKTFKGNYKWSLIILIASLLSWLTSFNTVYSLSDYRILTAVAFLVSLVIISNRSLNSKDEILDSQYF